MTPRQLATKMLNEAVKRAKRNLGVHYVKMTAIERKHMIEDLISTISLRGESPSGRPRGAKARRLQKG